RRLCSPIRTLAWAALTCVLGAAAAGFSAESPPQRPNVVLILLDNCGQEWLGCYGSDEKRTPHIDELARGGVRFEHCYTFPVCGPSRIELLSGRYPLHTGFTMHHDAALYSGGGLDPGREVVFARRFREAGYATGIAGKWQVNNLYDEPGILARHGFDEHLVWPGSIDRDRISADDLRRFHAAIEAREADTLSVLNQAIESRYWDPVVLRNGRREVLTGKFGPDVFQEFALDFLDRHRRDPFLLYLPMVLTHGQSVTQHVVATPPNRQDQRPQHDMYGAMVEYADRLIGQVVDRLTELGLRERTLVVVATDNGSEPSLIASRYGRPAPGGLYQLTEAGSDVGLLVNCPRLVPGGRTIGLADFTDVYPTLCELAGIALPQKPKLDGHSHAAVLRQVPEAAPARRWILNQLGTRRAVRDRRYKLYSTGELFDVRADREEQHDLARSERADVVAARDRLRRVLASLPPDSPPPIELRSLSAFKLAKQPETRPAP
ncbi:MAG TPA: sulfatase-like hydrolase/transferase, partial [Pirellulales bacterium]|nr:sulfatase-like hydrolase/transferase [Pirellulales bacterium]